MYNLHTHSLLSDGVLLPSELAARYMHAGYKAIAITDHADYSNIDFVISSILKFIRFWPEGAGIKILPGIELTHLLPQQFKPLAKYAREKGIKVIIAHGETTVEPIAKGTNRAALKADIDILAHPGLISIEDARLAKKRGIFLEITTRKGHLRTNAHVIKIARKIRAKLILNHDAHLPQDIISAKSLKALSRRMGLTNAELNKIQQNTENFIKA